MKRVFIVLLVLVLVAGVVFAQQRFTRGSKTGTGTSAISVNNAEATNTGRMTVEVTFNATRMTKIEVKEHTDTAVYLKLVTDNMIPAMIRAQSTDVDNISGATFSSRGLKQAVADAIEQARR